MSHLDPSSTRWSLISLARQADPDVRKQALEALLQRYRSVLIAHLIRTRRCPPQHAEDLVHDFVADKILEKQFLQHADRTRGKFRSLLFRSLENFSATALKKEQRDNVAQVSLTADDDNPIDVADSVASDAFDIDWARRVLAEAVERMRAQCQSDARAWLWPVFDGRILGPTFRNEPPLPYEQLVARFGFESPKQASHALVTVKRQFQKLLEGVVSEYLVEADDLAAELADLGRILAQAPPVADARTHDSVKDTNASVVLARIFDVSTAENFDWQPADMAGLLLHQLAAAWRPLLCEDASVARHLPPAGSITGTNEPVTFADLFAAPRPPVVVLNAVKRWSKHLATGPLKSLPLEITTVLYYATIAAGLVRHQHRITTSDDAALLHGFNRLLSCSWLTADLRQLFSEARQDIAAGTE